MNTIREIVPATWSETDERFFRVVAEVFSTEFLWGAGSLLASYDSDPAATKAGATGAIPASDATHGLPDPSAVRA